MRLAFNTDYAPTVDFSEIFGTLDRLVSSSLGEAAPKLENSRFATDFFEDDTHFHLRLELPGAKKEDVGIDVENRVLTVSEADGRRAFQLPEAADSEAIAAQFADGLLTVSIARAEETKARSISIN